MLAYVSWCWRFLMLIHDCTGFFPDCRLLSLTWVHLDTVSRQIFKDIWRTQFSGSKMEVHVHLKNTFQAELETEGSRLATIFGLPPTPRWMLKSRIWKTFDGEKKFQFCLSNNHYNVQTNKEQDQNRWRNDHALCVCICDVHLHVCKSQHLLYGHLCVYTNAQDINHPTVFSTFAALLVLPSFSLYQYLLSMSSLLPPHNQIYSRFWYAFALFLRKFHSVNPFKGNFCELGRARFADKKMEFPSQGVSKTYSILFSAKFGPFSNPFRGRASAVHDERAEWTCSRIVLCSKKRKPPRMEVETLWVSTLKKNIRFGNKFDCLDGVTVQLELANLCHEMKRSAMQHGFQFFVLTLFIFKAPNYVLARTLTERVV